MPYYKITTNKRGELVAKVQVLTKDITTGKNKLVVKRIYNTEKLTDAKFRKQVEKFSLTFEDEVREALENQTEQLKSNVLTFPKLADEYVANVRLHLSQNYYEKVVETIKKFNAYLEKRQLYKVPVNEIKVRDVQLFFDSFTTYSRKQTRVKLKAPLPENVNFRLLDREKILNKGSAYKLRYNHDSIPTANAMKLCTYYNLSFGQYFEDMVTVKPYSVETIKGYRKILRAIFSEAIRYDWITKNPVSATKVGAGNSNAVLNPISEKEVFNYSEVQKFLAALNRMGKNQINKKIVLKTMLLTGIRKGEMSGLRWSDIDFENGTIHIRRNRLYSVEKGTYEKEPKTKTSVRYIPIPDTLIKDLQEYYEWFKETDKDFDNKLDEYYLAATITREPAPTSAPYNWLCEFLYKNNLKHVGCHSLRHTYCSLLLSQNVPIQTVSKYMGHSNSTVTLKVYSHFIPDTQDKVLSVLNHLTAQ